MAPNTLRNIMILGALCGLAACAPKIETQPVTAELPPAQPPSYAVGDTMVHLNKLTGVEETSRVVSASADIVEVVNETSGCRYAFKPGTYAPGLAWQNCQGYTGTRKLTGSEGSIYPMQVGASVAWSAEGTDDKGNTWDGSQTCKVEGTAKVTTVAGTFDTYHVRCNTDSRVRNYYVDPASGRNVITQSTHSGSGTGWHYELLSYTSAATS